MDHYQRPRLDRDCVLRALAVAGVLTLLFTEGLSLFQALNRITVISCWMAAAGGAAWWISKRHPVIPKPSTDWFVLGCSAGVATLLALTGVTALVSAPNSADAMAYHLPRVVYWIEQSSVRFFPTPYLNQIMLQPLAEYFMLHTWLLTGGDHFVNLVQWFASAGSILAVSAIAREFGAGVRGQAVAALFAATIPTGVLASSGAKNDYVLTLCLALAVYFALRFTATAHWRDAILLGAALGLALLTKGTAYVFAPWPLAAIIAWSYRRTLRRGLVVAVLAALAINAPHCARNIGLSGSPLGFDSAQGDGFFRWQNETFGWRQTLSNAARHVSEQLGGRSERWNTAVYQRVAQFHRQIGIGLNDPATTWRWSEYRPPRKANHEADTGAPWHLAIAVLLFFAVGYRYPKAAWYAASLAVAFVAFCFYLKWQPFMARLFLPLFVLSAPMVGLWLPPRIWLQVPLALFLLGEARLPALENWTRPLRGPRNIFVVPRDDQYVADLVQFPEHRIFRDLATGIAKSGCGAVAIDANVFQVEYPLMALLRERNPEVVFFHDSVHNASARYAPPVTRNPCSIVCIRCGQGPVVRFLQPPR